MRLNHFDRGKPFYPLILNYVTQLIGFRDLLVHGTVDLYDREKVINETLSKFEDQEITKEVHEGISETLGKLTGPLQLRSEYEDDTIEIDIDLIANELADNYPYLLSFTLRSSGILLILAHEISKDKSWHTNNSLWEFLRHCRNAAAHNGKFNLIGDEPRRSAEWGNMEITADLHGTQLFKDEEGNGFLSPGDPIRLLWDIEQAYPEMAA